MVGCRSYSISIVVKKELKNVINIGTTAILDVENDDFKEYLDRISAPHSAYITQLMEHELKKLGIVTCGDKTVPDLRIKCVYRYDWGMPRIIRHFRIKTSYVYFVNIKIIDIPENRVIGEVESTRPRFKEMPPTFIKMMFDELFKNSNIMG